MLPISYYLAGISIGNGTKNAAIYCAIGSGAHVILKLINLSERLLVFSALVGYQSIIRRTRDELINLSERLLVLTDCSHASGAIWWTRVQPSVAPLIFADFSLTFR